MNLKDICIASFWIYFSIILIAISDCCAGLERSFKKQSKTKLLNQSISSSKNQQLRQMDLRLLRVERFLSIAMMLRKDSTTEPRKRLHAVKKWRRAIKLASSLAVPTYYRAFLTANLHFDQRRWKEADWYFECCLRDSRLWKTNGTLEWISSVATSLRRYCQHMSKTDVESTGVSHENMSADNLKILMKSSSPDNLMMTKLYTRCERWTNLLQRPFNKLQGDGDKVCDIRSSVYGNKANITASQVYDIARYSQKCIRCINDIYLEVNTDEGWRKQCQRACQYLGGLQNIARATHRIIKGKSNRVPEMMTELKDCAEELIFFELNINPCQLWKFLKPQLECIVKAYKYLKDNGYELSSSGPQPILKPTTFLETIDQHLIFRDPIRQGIFNPRNFKELIPPKPLFYDLAYDFLPPPPAV